jgi:hypothetical protein
MSNSIESNKGPSVRATALVVGTDYIMATWTKPDRTHQLVKFLGFDSINAPVTPIPQLKTLTVDSKFYFQNGDELIVADGRTAGNVFTGEGAGHRVTFFSVVGTYEDLAGGSLDNPLAELAPVENVKEFVEA